MQLYKQKTCYTEVMSLRRTCSPLQQVTEWDTAPPAVEMPTGDTHSWTRTPASSVCTLCVTGLVLLFCTRETHLISCTLICRTISHTNPETHHRLHKGRCYAYWRFGPWTLRGVSTGRVGCSRARSCLSSTPGRRLFPSESANPASGGALLSPLRNCADWREKI